LSASCLRVICEHVRKFASNLKKFASRLLVFPSHWSFASIVRVICEKQGDFNRIEIQGLASYSESVQYVNRLPVAYT
jgi:aspartokinase-like uncharacterized kinase